MESHLPIKGAEEFTRSAREVVEYLAANTPLTDWSLSRVTNGEQVHVHVHHQQLIAAGDRIEWNKTFCSRMARGAAHVVRDARTDPDYADLQAAQKVGAYVGYVIEDDTDELFGVLCGVRRAPLVADEYVDEELVRLVSEMLSTQLKLSRVVDRERRKVAVAEALAQSDELTGALNRRGWNRVIADAQERLTAFGDPIAVALFDLDNLKSVNDQHGHDAGDRLLQQAAAALKRASAPSDRIARIGGDEFAILSNGVSPQSMERHFGPFRHALASAGLSAASGYAAATPADVTIEQALKSADTAMYADKRNGRSLRG
ncbi:GGDEF domain-containing protein [Leucobacter manosquensis]|uniref:GGDEF domain-containing protein n=1 Tax=Leucobacter manosquensis TaxID=2810611 RepID=A0ABS5M5C5_9MICO|nr:GGDEF domain-containing protein [Leucobacter manosquensis]MBS3182409.1 GGDEF domain-containing protein [Leucobacter manosquensis]